MEAISTIGKPYMPGDSSRDEKLGFSFIFLLTVKRHRQNQTASIISAVTLETNTEADGVTKRDGVRDEGEQRDEKRRTEQHTGWLSAAGVDDEETEGGEQFSCD